MEDVKRKGNKNKIGSDDIKYKVYNKKTNNINGNLLENFFLNRNVYDYQHYLNLTSCDEIPYSNLDNMKEAVNLFDTTFKNKRKIQIIVDEDTDGFASASILYMYIKRLDKDYPVKYILQPETKSHGLSDSIKIDDDTDLLILPDAGTNDAKQMKKLKEKKPELKILVLDHHPKDEENNFALIVNNQISKNYTNKQLSGVGIVYKFLQALDELYWNDFADDYLDLVALGNIADVMDIRSFETKFYINKGLKNIQNKCFKALLDSQEYSIKGKICPHTISWYISPLINGMIRFGSKDEKELLFKAFIQEGCFFEYKKKGEIIEEDIYTRAARLCKNAKRRQDNARDKYIEQLYEKINPNDKIIIIDTTDIGAHRELNGVLAMKLSSAYKKPCIILSQAKTQENVLTGSARNFENSPIENFKNIINNSNIFNFALGHSNAFGVGLNKNNLAEATRRINTLLENISATITYIVDYVLNPFDFDVSIVRTFDNMDKYYGKGLEEVKILVDDIVLSKDKISIMGKNQDTIAFEINGIKYLLFKHHITTTIKEWVDDGWDDNKYIKLKLVGKPKMNDFKGILTPQVLIDDIVITGFTNECSEYQDKEIDNFDW